MDRLARIDMVYRLLEKEPNDVFLNYTLGLEQAAEKNLKEAEKLFSKVISLDKNYIAAYYQLGKLLESLSRDEEALNILNEGLAKAKEQKNNKAISEFSEAIFMIEE